MLVQGWRSGVGAGGSHTYLFGATFSVSLALVYLDTVSYIVTATLELGLHLVGVSEGTWLMACFWAQP